ncbi:MAG: DUF2318 domain-containing protein [Clostridiaceae bacterium]
MKNNKKTQKPAVKKKSTNVVLGIIAILVIGIAILSGMKSNSNNKTQVKESGVAIAATINEKGDAIIPVSEISQTATFYSYDKLDTKIEFLAVKASDGTIRTAFNTCQVCYASGRGYYKQEGDVLKCQNCGNIFKMDQVEIVKGGCNPVPIFEEYKETTDSSIIIKSDNFKEAESIFANWKN